MINTILNEQRLNLIEVIREDEIFNWLCRIKPIPEMEIEAFHQWTQKNNI